MGLTKDNTIQFYLPEQGLGKSNRGDNVGFNLYVFSIRYRKIFMTAQTIKVEFKVSACVPAGAFGYALVLTKRGFFIKYRERKLAPINIS